MDSPDRPDPTAAAPDGGTDLAAVAADVADPQRGLRAVAALRRLTDELELKQVEAALAAGLGWSEIAAALGVTRQGAHKKFSRRVSTELRSPRRTDSR
ncbi:hypothetical protein ACL90Y_09520 [Micrococcus luteus]